MPSPEKDSLAGKILLSHPAMKHDAFRRTVVLITAHDAGGAMGVILNRPLGKTLDDTDARFAGNPLGPLPLYEGGPVAGNQLIFSGWHRSMPDKHFHLYFGLTRERALDMAVSDPGIRLRCFLGHAGWAPGQLENEMKHNGWLASPMDAESVNTIDGVALWHAMLGKHHPAMRLLADAPDSPELN